jgi:hypothetical protein
MMDKKKFLEKMDAVGRLIQAGNMLIAARTLLDVGMEDMEAAEFIASWKQYGPPDKKTLVAAWEGMRDKERSERIVKLLAEPRPDVDITQAKIDDLSKMLEGAVDPLEFLKLI